MSEAPRETGDDRPQPGGASPGRASAGEQPLMMLHVGDDGLPRGRMYLRPSEHPEAREALARLEARQRDPAHRARMAALRQGLHASVALGEPPIAVVDGPLPDGAMAWVVRDPSAPRPRLVIVSARSVDDVVLRRATSALRHRETTVALHPTRRETTVLWADGRVRLAVDGEPARVSQTQFLDGHRGDRFRRTRSLLRRTRRGERIKLARLGAARVVPGRPFGYMSRAARIMVPVLRVLMWSARPRWSPVRWLLDRHARNARQRAAAMD